MNHSTTRIVILSVLLGIAALQLGACGQKGPLFLPDETTEQKQDKAK